MFQLKILILDLQSKYLSIPEKSEDESTQNAYCPQRTFLTGKFQWVWISLIYLSKYISRQRRGTCRTLGEVGKSYLKCTVWVLYKPPKLGDVIQLFAFWADMLLKRPIDWINVMGQNSQGTQKHYSVTCWVKPVIQATIFVLIKHPLRIHWSSTNKSYRLVTYKLLVW